ncbi:hypothetical protein [Streptomyces sp. NPDC051561]|uniref:hypothetical protein n=1 Tax=Streptomyces sp. NPDC051561 TaxID=3365658 RepID=UPI0037B04706
MNSSNPHGPTPERESGTGSGVPDPVSIEAALEMVVQVTAAYRRQLHTERQALAPDQERLAALAESVREAQVDQRALEEADDAEIARIAARYEAAFKDLSGQ